MSSDLQDIPDDLIARLGGLPMLGSVTFTPTAQAEPRKFSGGVTIGRDTELRRAALAVITAHARWLGSGAEDVEYEGLTKAMDALKEALAK